MDSKAVAMGFVLYFIANFIVATFLTGIAVMVGGFFGALGTIAIILGSSIVTFPVIIFTFWAAHKGGLDAEIPETG